MKWDGGLRRTGGRRDMIEIHGMENFKSENKTFKMNKEAKLKKKKYPKEYYSAL